MEKKLKEKGVVYKDEIAWELLSDSILNLKFSKIFIIVDENTKQYCLSYLFKKHQFETTPEIITISVGEAHKNIETCLKVWETLSEKGADRKSLIINLGGGVVTDLGGFVASTFMRGISFINIPTSLLAMVDASVGGKNGVDLGHKKNQIGIINLPEMVILDTEFLKTLPQEHIISGLAEMLKHGLIYNKEYWERVKNADYSKKIEFEKLIWDSVEIKKGIVTKDPLEKNLRKTLNYGHTLGHAIESYFLESSDKKSLLHGEAVAVGLILATYISTETFSFPKDTLKDVSQSILKYFPKQYFTENDIAAIINLLAFDKKNRNGKVLFVLLEDIGSHKYNCEVNNKLIYSAFEYYKNL
ncbi:3-dehydroquinate synthase [Aequorivita sp. CIP111184]|uniref:3-dehydroquinate synthase n=1 Tax=Aequorivita sp. CIP111184 TaxID=2211356 RepID=UPI000DBBE5DB|nr:3-dehydroquinate synthase [Aequorivita sp. CIP111184]SRX55833.1 3-dehydroquinate synthase [Aequorivita sp. CIP111184]